MQWSSKLSNACVVALALAGCTAMRVAPPDEGLFLTIEKAEAATPDFIIVDARDTRTTKNTPIENGIVVNESILTPTPRAFVRDELVRQIRDHHKRPALEAMLAGKAARLMRFDVLITLGGPVGEINTRGMPPGHAAFGALINEMNRRKVISVHLRLDVDNKPFEGKDNDNFELAIPSSHAAIAAARLAVRRAVEAMAEDLP